MPDSASDTRATTGGYVTRRGTPEDVQVCASRSLAEGRADMMRGRGLSARILKRAIRADNCKIDVWVVVGRRPLT